jgi:amphi-Trp domain-containing protein
LGWRCAATRSNTSREDGSMEINEVRLESTMELSNAIAYLEDVVAGLKSGRINVQHEEDSLVLAPQRNVTVRIKARQKNEKESIGLKVSWQVPRPSKDGESPLRITSAPAENGDE